MLKEQVRRGKEIDMQSRRMPIYVLAAVMVAIGARLAGVSSAGLLPFAFLLVCPIMMIVMMKGMGGHGRSDKEDHTGHGCEHDPVTQADGLVTDSVQPASPARVSPKTS